MTLEEAIKHCEEVADTPCFTDEEARCYFEHRQLAEWLKELKRYKEQGEDCISRNAAIVQLSHNKIGDDDCDAIIQKDIETIKALPPVTPQPKTGHWIGIDEEPHEDYECDKCGYTISTYTANIEPHTEYKYCPNCGDRKGAVNK